MHIILPLNHVQIPGADGRAGMATIVDDDNSLDLKQVANSLNESLPAYAQPVFLRIAKKIDMTSKILKFCLLLVRLYAVCRFSYLQIEEVQPAKRGVPIGLYGVRCAVCSQGKGSSLCHARPAALFRYCWRKTEVLVYRSNLTKCILKVIFQETKVPENKNKIFWIGSTF